MENIKPNKLMWSKDMNTKFEMIKNILSKDPVMAYPKMDFEFQIHVDASAKGLGTVLTQLINSQYRVKEYASKRMTKTQQRYSNSVREG